MHRGVLALFPRSRRQELPLKSAFQKEKAKEAKPLLLHDPLQRLSAIEHDLETIPRIFCDSISTEPLNDPLVLGIGQEQAIEKKSLIDDDISDLQLYYKNGRYINPHNRSYITLPFLFDPKRQEKLKTLLERVLALKNPPHAAVALDPESEKASLAEEIAEFSAEIMAETEQPDTSEWAKLLNHIRQFQANFLLETVLPSLYILQSDEASDLKIFDNIEEEKNIIEASLFRFQKDEAQRRENERWLKEKYENYVFSLEKIHALKELIVSGEKMKEQSKLGDILSVHEQSHPDQALKKELAKFISETLPLIDAYERSIVLGQEEALLKELMRPHQEKIHSLIQELENIESELRQGKDVSSLKDISQQVIHILHAKEMNQRKLEVTEKLLIELKEVRNASFSYSEEEKEALTEMDLLIESLTSKKTEPALEKESEEDKDPLLGKLSLFVSNKPSYPQDKGKGKEKESEHPHRPGAPSLGQGRSLD